MPLHKSLETYRKHLVCEKISKKNDTHGDITNNNNNNDNNKDPYYWGKNWLNLYSDKKVMISLTNVARKLQFIYLLDEPDMHDTAREVGMSS